MSILTRRCMWAWCVVCFVRFVMGACVALCVSSLFDSTCRVVAYGCVRAVYGWTSLCKSDDEQGRDELAVEVDWWL